MAHGELGVIETLKLRAAADPVNLIATLLFIGAIMHTFAAGPFMKLAHKYEHENEIKAKADKRVFVDGKDPVCFKATLFHFLGEIEAIFGIWLVPLLLYITVNYGWDHTTHYIDTRNFTEPVFVVVIMAIAASRPVVAFAERALRLCGANRQTHTCRMVAVDFDHRTVARFVHY